MGLQKQMSDLRDKTQVRIDPMIQTVDHFETSAEILNHPSNKGSTRLTGRFRSFEWILQRGLTSSVPNHDMSMSPNHDISISSALLEDS